MIKPQNNNENVGPLPRLGNIDIHSTAPLVATNILTKSTICVQYKKMLIR